MFRELKKALKRNKDLTEQQKEFYIKHKNKCSTCAFIFNNHRISDRDIRVPSDIDIRMKDNVSVFNNCFHLQFTNKGNEYLNNCHKCKKYIKYVKGEERTLLGIEIERKEGVDWCRNLLSIVKDAFIIAISVASILVTFVYASRDDVSDTIWQNTSEKQNEKIISELKNNNELNKLSSNELKEIKHKVDSLIKNRLANMPKVYGVK